MSNYTKQVSRSHYQDSHYDSSERFTGYFIQKEMVLSRLIDMSSKVLEVGPGTGVLSSYIKNLNYDLKTLDIAADLKPDIVGNIIEADLYVKDTYDVVCCFEVLEHLKFEDVSKAVKSISKINSKYLLVSVPQIRLYMSIWLKLPTIKSRSFYISLPFPRNHKFDGQHYWELGARKFTKSNFLDQFKGYYVLESEFTEPLDPYHRYFVFKKSI